jgi:hypothetical protein
MAERRMFAKTIIDSDAFIDMPVTARLLYYDLAMRADDDGFVNSPKKIMRMIGASQDDLSILIMRKFIIPFDSGIVVIKHWRIHNYIRKDMYHETKYKEEKETLSLDENNAYTLHHRNESVTNMLQTCNEPVTSSSTEDRIGKDRIGKDSINNPPKRKRFVPPTIDEVKAYCNERHNNVDAERFIDYYSSQKWKKANGRPLEDWKAAVRTWEKNSYDKPKQPTMTVPVPDYMQKQIEDFEKNYGW